MNLQRLAIPAASILFALAVLFPPVQRTVYGHPLLSDGHPMGTVTDGMTFIAAIGRTQSIILGQWIIHLIITAAVLALAIYFTRPSEAAA